MPWDHNRPRRNRLGASARDLWRPVRRPDRGSTMADVDSIDAWVWWLIGAAGLGIALVVTAMPELGMLALGAVAGAVTAGLGGGVVLQVLVFAVVSVALIAVVRPIAAGTVPATPTRDRHRRVEGQTGRRPGTGRRHGRPDQAGRRDLVRPRPRHRPGLRGGSGSGRRGDRGSHGDRHVTSYDAVTCEPNAPRGSAVCQTRPARSSQQA